MINLKIDRMSEYSERVTKIFDKINQLQTSVTDEKHQRQEIVDQIITNFAKKYQDL